MTSDDEAFSWKSATGRAIADEIDRQVVDEVTSTLARSTPPSEDSSFYEMWCKAKRHMDSMRHGNWDLVPDEIAQRVRSSPTHADVSDGWCQAYHDLGSSGAEVDLVPVPWPDDWPRDAQELRDMGINVNVS